MSGFPSRPLASHMRQPSLSANAGGQSPALVARVNEKKAELENLKELRHLSAEAATQMEALEQKLATLSDGTEAIALVLSNWHNVLRAINMASAKLPKPAADAEDETPLPQTLVRIPTEHAPALQAHAEGAAEETSG
ncbi:DASH complex subunit Dad2-domain-containing protein [Chaetomium tenue]|uniref:DASH complex subunit Dad2-domain-containing protein n=1 Tax=Chaetomium tenue TaxID=1854479 RepID=A0ACB7PKX0_9PEZI|nr:DASH complex subunit Dad2-domain-containing protein [Chaetomium globosum]